MKLEIKHGMKFYCVRCSYEIKIEIEVDSQQQNLKLIEYKMRFGLEHAWIVWKGTLILVWQLS